MDSALADAVAVATLVGVAMAVVASTVAVASLRSQAKSQELNAIIETNKLWLNVAESARKVTLSEPTVRAIRRAYDDLIEGDNPSVLSVNAAPDAVTMEVPYIVGALLPEGVQGKESAPETEDVYVRDVRARTLVLGYLRTVLEKSDPRPSWLSVAVRQAVVSDFAALDKAMAAWVNPMNEVAELYDGDLVDRRRFAGKRSGAIIRQMAVAEPYILWRNSTTSGRWGVRVLGLGAEVRQYHWRSPLQRAGLRLVKDPDGYAGFSERFGWIVGPGSTPDNGNPFVLSVTEARLRRRIGAGFSTASKARQNRFVETLPRDPDSGLEPGQSTWSDVVADPARVRDSIALLSRQL
ncbi:MAG TPA: hypothetical protein VNQ77_06040 [Frankiaceae bacterium]|nr:hypothetical protein [Frankiaceae bacterium]